MTCNLFENEMICMLMEFVFSVDYCFCIPFSLVQVRISTNYIQIFLSNIIVTLFLYVVLEESNK